MKLKPLNGLVLAAALLPLPALAANESVIEEVTAEASAQETVSLSVVACKGGG